MSTAVVDQLVKRWVTGDAPGMVDLCHPDHGGAPGVASPAPQRP